MTLTIPPPKIYPIVTSSVFTDSAKNLWKCIEKQSKNQTISNTQLYKVIPIGGAQSLPTTVINLF
ncbi:MAG: hypothetical protein ACSHXF_16115 [Aquaticitalea sp.]